jgi:hypothetical protein
MTSPLARLATFAFLAMLALPASATSVRPMTVPEMVATASIAFDGVCDSNREDVDAATGFPVTLTTFTVTDVLKGEVGATHTIKQIGARNSQRGTGGFGAHGVPTFAPGQRYVVMLYGVSAQGFSSPVGLAQGSFPVSQDARGATVTNGRDFRETLPAAVVPTLPPGIKAMIAAPAGPVRAVGVDDFKAAIRQLSGAPK